MLQVEMFGAGAVLIYHTEQIHRHIMQWWLACSLDPQCVALTRQSGCDFRGEKWKQYAHCHRYDQSVLNILVTNFFQYNTTSYTPGVVGGEGLKAQHLTTNHYKVKYCDTVPVPMGWPVI